MTPIASIANLDSPPSRPGLFFNHVFNMDRGVVNMGKRHPNLPAWQWRAYPGNHQHPTNLVLHLIAVPLFIVAFLLIVSGVFSLSLASVAIGVIGIVAALALQRHGHSLEAQASEPFSDRKDAVSRLLVEQFLTFPRFFLSGGWWRAWRERHRRH
jgi:phage terminase small subunit